MTLLISGRGYEEVRPGLRGMLCGKHIIFYRIISKEKVRIVRILHGKMDYPRHLEKMKAERPLAHCLRAQPSLFFNTPVAVLFR